MKRVAIIGAGLSGLVLARRLRDVADITLFEKSRGVGGRLATRYAGDYEFDHGAQFITARTPAFREFLQPLIRDGVVANWKARFAELDRSRTRDQRTWGEDYPHYVGVPRMNAIGKYLSQGLTVHMNTRIVEQRRIDGKWTLADSQGNCYAGFDWLVLTAPAPQAADLASGAPGLTALCERGEMLPCFSLMLGFRGPRVLPWQAAVVRECDISWMCVNSSKPGRKMPFTLLVHSTNAWASAHINDDAAAVRRHMLDEAEAVSGVELGAADYCNVHRWRYANADKQTGPDSYIDADTRLAACGDWFIRGRVEAAFSSATSLADRLLERL